MYKVFISDKPLNIQENSRYGVGERVKIFVGTQRMSEAIEYLEKDKADEVFILGNVEELWDNLKSRYTIIEAAGGLVRNARGEILFIYRLDKWDLPKGKIDERETKELAAIREVEEECGISGLEIVKELEPTYHTYEMKGDKILKCTYWFDMKTNDDSPLVAQAEENIEAAVWVNASDISTQLGNTYNSVKEVLGSI